MKVVGCKAVHVYGKLHCSICSAVLPVFLCAAAVCNVLDRHALTVTIKLCMENNWSNAGTNLLVSVV